MNLFLMAMEFNGGQRAASEYGWQVNVVKSEGQFRILIHRWAWNGEKFQLRSSSFISRSDRVDMLKY